MHRVCDFAETKICIKFPVTCNIIILFTPTTTIEYLGSVALTTHPLTPPHHLLLTRCWISSAQTDCTPDSEPHRPTIRGCDYDILLAALARILGPQYQQVLAGARCTYNRSVVHVHVQSLVIHNCQRMYL